MEKTVTASLPQRQRIHLPQSKRIPQVNALERRCPFVLPPPVAAPVTVRSLTRAVAEYVVALDERRPLHRLVRHVERAAEIAIRLGDMEACAPLPGSRAFALDVVRALADLGLLDDVASDFDIEAMT